MALKTTPFDAAEHLTDVESISAFVADAFESGDAVIIADALGIVARAKGMTEVAKGANLSRESLYRTLSKAGNPEFATIIKVMNSLGMQLTAKPIH